MITPFLKILMSLAALTLITTACAPMDAVVTQLTPTDLPSPTMYATVTSLPTIVPATVAPASTSTKTAPTATKPIATLKPTTVPLLTLTPTINLPKPDNLDPSVVTLDQNNMFFTLHTGETFLLKLGDDIYQWDVQIDHPDVMSRVKNIAVVRGAQGVYQATRAGTATLTATGDALCRQSKPACMVPSRLFVLHIEVMS